MPEQFGITEFEERIAKALPLVGKPALALLQGYALTRLLDGSSVIRSLQPPNTWEDCFDLRLFGPEGEWHAWNLGGGQWGARMWLAKDQDKRLLLEREFPLWGNEVKLSENGWSLLREARGAEIWVPERAVPKPPRSNGGETLAVLKAVELVGFDPSSGLAGIVDCVLRAVEVNTHA